MVQNITLSAPKQLIARARRQYERRGTSLNAEFRKWLEEASADQSLSPGQEYLTAVGAMRGGDIGGKITRDQRNTRHYDGMH